MDSRTIRANIMARVVRGHGMGRVVRGGLGPPGRSATAGFGVTVRGPFNANECIAFLPAMGAATYTAGGSKAEADVACAAEHVWRVTKGGTFADHETATDLEIAAALFATITFPAGPGAAAWTFAGDGAVVEDDKLRIWEAAIPDATQRNTFVGFGS